MPRGLRLEGAGCWYHVTARGNERRWIYRQDADREHFLDLLAEAVERFRFRLHAYVLLRNHYHLVLTTLEPNLARSMHWLNTSYSVWFNRRYQRSGHLFQGRYGSVMVEPESWGVAVTWYVHLNPARVERLGLSKGSQRRERRGVGLAPSAELVRARLAVLRNYRWSSYRAYVGWEKPPSWLTCEEVLALSGGDPRQWRRRYRESVEAQVRAGTTQSPWAELVNGWLLGASGFVAAQLASVGEKGAAAPERARGSQRPSFGAIIRATEQALGSRWIEFRDEYGHAGRDLALYVGRKRSGLTLRQLAEAAAMNSPMAVHLAIKRCAQRLEGDPSLRKVLALLEEKLKLSLQVR